MPNFTDTAESTYLKCVRCSDMIFLKNIGIRLKKNKIQPIKQNNNLKTFHLSKDFKKLGYINLNKKYKAKDLINLLRAKTLKNLIVHFFHKKKN